MYDRQTAYCERILREMIDRGIIKGKDFDKALSQIKMAYATGFDEGRYYRNPRQRRMVGQFSKDGIRKAVYPSLQAAAHAVGVSKSAIYNCCKGKSKTSKGFYWIYLD